MHGAAAHAAQVAHAIRASGAVVEVDLDVFVDVLRRAEAPLVIVARGGIFRKHWRYLTPYRGLVFLTKSDAELVLPPRSEILSAEKIWMPE